MLPAGWTTPGRASLSPRTAPEPFSGAGGGLKSWLGGSAALHAGIAAAVIGASVWFAMHHGEAWGGAAVNAGAIQATLVSNAPSLPIPTPQTPTDNVLATENPSPAPTPPQPAPKAAAPEPDAIAIPEKTAPPPKAKPQPKETPATKSAANAPPQPKPLTKPLPIPKPANRVPTGEAAPANIPRANPNAPTGNSPVTVGGDFGFRFGWYVDGIKRKAAQNWYRQLVDPRTPAGARVFLTFDISRDGQPSNIRVEKSSGSATLDSTAIQALQRVDTFGPLPPGYNGSRLNVEYYFQY